MKWISLMTMAGGDHAVVEKEMEAGAHEVPAELVAAARQK